jgi:hypothetical protein
MDSIYSPANEDIPIVRDDKHNRSPKQHSKPHLLDERSELRVFLARLEQTDNSIGGDLGSLNRVRLLARNLRLANNHSGRHQRNVAIDMCTQITAHEKTIIYKSRVFFPPNIMDNCDGEDTLIENFQLGEA